jgi:uncharacterized repeat protein (TIGR01451 family)
MKRKLLAFITSLMLLLSILFVGNVVAHPVTVIVPGSSLGDKSRSEWFPSTIGTPNVGVGMIQRNNVGQGEFVFNDYPRDHRVVTATADLTKSTDLDWFAITGDATNVYFIAKMDSIAGVTLSPTPELMVSIDTDHAGGTNVELPNTTSVVSGSVGISVTAAAEWEYVVQSDFGTAPNTGAILDPRIWTSSSQSLPGRCSPCEAQLSSVGSFIELKVPWTQIGGKPAPNQFLRFTASIYRKDREVPLDGHTPALIDVASRTRLTTDVLAQGAITSYFDVRFDAAGEVFSPLLISEFNPNPIGSDVTPSQHTEWIEIYNPNTFSVNLSEYKIGDAAGAGAEGMLQFPTNTTLAAGGIAIVAQLKNRITPTPTGSPQLFNQSELTPYPAWSSGTTIGLDNNRDQIVLLDGSDTIVNFVEYTVETNPTAAFVNSQPYVFPPSGAPESDFISYERCPPLSDIHNTAVEFLVHDSLSGDPPTPGTPCPPATGVDLTIQKAALPPVVLADNTTTVNFFIDWSNNGGGVFNSIIVTDTLPANVTLVSQSSQPAAAFTPSPGPGQPMQWEFNLGQTTNVSGTIVLTATVSSNAAANVPLVNTAGVYSNDPARVEDPGKLGDNFAEASVTPSKPDMAVSSTWPGGAPANTDVNYVITYANNGAGDAQNVIVTDTLPLVPQQVTYVSSNPPATVNGRVLTWNIGDLAAHATGTISVRVHITSGQSVGTQITNNIAITATPPDDPTATDDNTESRILVVGVSPDLRVSTSNWPNRAAPGTQFCYTINYSYPNGALPASDVTVKDVLPIGLTLVSQTSNPALTFSAVGNTLTWTRATNLAVGQSGSIGVCVKINSNVLVNSTVNNVVTISGSVDPDPNAGNNKETKPLTFDPHRVLMPLIRK